ncbi:glycine cleavage H-protein [Lactarius psammicola]|nr:glycine cleavage H-protein [Lactarius psammicola]
MYRSAKLYTPEHEVIKFDDETGVGTVSITDYAQKSLGDVVFVELPEIGATVEQGGESSSSFVSLGSWPSEGSYQREFSYIIEPVGAVESVKAASDIFAPVSGDVVGINEELGSQPSLLNKSPEDDGWLFQLKLSEPKELEDLLSEDDYKKHCES